MSSKRKTSGKQLSIEFLVGMFFIVGILILGIFTVIINVKEGGEEIIYVDFDNIDKIKDGEKVLLRGLEIGNVESSDISPDDYNKVRLTLNINKKYDFYNDYLIEIRDRSVLGGKIVYIELGSKEKGAYSKNVFQGKSPEDIFRKASKFLDGVNDAVHDIKAFTKKLQTEGSTLDKVISDDELYDAMLGALSSFKTNVDKVGNAADEVASLKGDAKDALVKIKEAGQSVVDAGKSIKTTSDNVNTMVTDAMKGKGDFGKFLTEDKLYTELLEITGEIKTFSKKLNDKDSSIGKVMHDKGDFYNSLKAAADDFSSAMKNINEVAGKINTGDGSLSKLINDPSLYDEAKLTLKDVQAAINDIREAAPIASLGSFIFGAL